MNEVALRASDVMLRINDVALRANGTEHLSHTGATILHPNTKVLDLQGLFVFLGVKYNPISPLHLSLNLLDLNLRHFRTFEDYALSDIR